MYRVYHLLSRDFGCGRAFSMNSVVLALDNGTRLVCSDFNHSRDRKIEIYVHLPKQGWVRTYEKNQLTEIMWTYYRKSVQQKKSHDNYEKMMRHSRKKKYSSGGSRLGNSSYTTDYECTKEPLHDFRRVMYLAQEG